MKYNIHYTKKSRRDLDEIWDYISSELQNIPAAECTVNRIMDEVDQLADFAEIGAPLPSISDMSSEYRYLLSGSYMIFYRAVGNEVFVDRVLYGRRDYLRVLFGDMEEEMTT